MTSKLDCSRRDFFPRNEAIAAKRTLEITAEDKEV